ncbi:hypothetical protein FVEN_g6476 [Fusarium venenatum]|nr:hypothetical protein FVEN_g6476 [Fusarium venenatum]
MSQRDAQHPLDVRGTMDSNDQIYDTLPLSGDQFRLLKLQHGQWDDSVVCYLAVHELASQPEFEALSYTWGSNQNCEVITINSSSVTIGANLESALRYIRLPDKPRVLWIDALCINQRDDTEKGHQVQNMCQVFSSATTVLAWLGPPHLNGERALSDMRQIGEKLAPVFRREADGNGILTSHGNAWDDIKNLSPDRIGLQVEAIGWDAIWDLCDRSFWRRMWIIQELALSGDLFDDRSNSRCIVGCGSEWVPLPVLSTFISVFGLMRSNPRWMNGSMARPFDRLKTDGAPAVEAMITVIWRFDSRFDHDREDRTLDNIMRLSRSFQVTDPRDKLYGLLGIITDHPIDVDYKLNVSQVYKSLVTSWIESKGNLHCILGNRAPLNDVGPSWLPQNSNQLLDGLPFRNLMRAAQGKGQYAQSPSISFMQEDNVMKARGIRLGRINHVVGPFWSSTNSQIEMDLVGKLNTDTDMNNMFHVLGNLYLSLPENVQDDV